MSSQEKFPQLPVEKILLYLNSEDQITFHLVSQTLFQKCKEFFLHIKKTSTSLCNKENIYHQRSFCRGLTHWCQPTNSWPIKNKTGNFHTIRESKPNYSICHYFALNVNKLKSWEIRKIISEYKGRMQYLFFIKKPEKKKYRPIVGIKLGYKTLENFYNKTVVNFKLVLDMFKKLQYSAPAWAYSLADLEHEDREVKIQDQRRNTLRRYSSEIILRKKTICLF